MISGSADQTLGGIAVMGMAREGASGVWIVDYSGHQVIHYSAPSPFAANMLIGYPPGQPVSGTSSQALSFPLGVAVDVLGNVWVADGSNNRVLRFSAPAASSPAADRVLGQANFTSGSANRGGSASAQSLASPWGLAVDRLGNIWVADAGNNRVLRYSSPTANNQSADLVLGQPDLVSAGAGSGLLSLNSPLGVALDTAGNVWVADKGNNRVLRYSVPLSSGMAADLVLGQSGVTSGQTLNGPYGVAVDEAGDVWVADKFNNRVLRFSTPTASLPSADLVLGQANLSSNGIGTSAQALSDPRAVAVDSAGNVWVADLGNTRALYYTGGVPTGLSGEPLSASSISWTWNSVAGAVSYLFYPSTGGPAISVAGGSLVQGGLASNTAYGARVAAVGGLNRGNLSALATAQTPLPGPDAPTGLAGTAQGTSSLTWTWNAVTGASGYRFYPSTGGAGIPAAGTSLSQVGLSTNTSYSGRVSAVDAIGESLLSSATSIYTRAAVPANLSRSSARNKSITFQWQTNGNPNGTVYSVEVAPLGGPYASGATTTSNSATVSGLAPATSYYLQVKAKNGDGISTAPSLPLVAQTGPCSDEATVPGTFAVNKCGSGGGSVTTGNGRINCGATCSFGYCNSMNPSDYNFVLSAAPDSGVVFAGWSGGGCSGTGTCVVDGTSLCGTGVAVTATFNAVKLLSVSKSGTGSGTVTSSPAGIDCGSTCSANVQVGVPLTLTATPGAAAIFVGWSGGGCSGTGPCTLNVTSDTAVAAVFNTIPALTVSRAGTGTGTVTSSPAGIDCGVTCAAHYSTGTLVTLSASPTQCSVFAGWSGGGCSGTGSCVVTLSASDLVTATFNDSGGGPVNSGMNASLVLGQPDFTSNSAATSQSGMRGVHTVFVDAGRNVWIASEGDNRVLELMPPFSNGKNANLVLGQPDFASNMPSGPASVNPYDGTWSIVAQVPFNDALFGCPPGGASFVVADGAFTAGFVLSGCSCGTFSGTVHGTISDSGAVVIAADSGGTCGFSNIVSDRDRITGSGQCASTTACSIPGTVTDITFLISAGSDAFPIELSRPSATPRETTRQGMSTPHGVAVDAGGNVWVAEGANGRVLEFKPPFVNGMNASVVLGQSDFNSHAIATTRSGMHNPIEVFTDVSGDVWVTEKANNRVLVFKPPFTNGKNATLVLGQPDFTSNLNSTTQTGLYSPGGISVDVSGNVWVVDAANNRVLEFKPPFSNGMNASLVLGQPDFLSNGAATTESGMDRPSRIFADRHGNLWVSERGNNRVVQFRPPFSNGMKACLVLGQQNFGSKAVGTTRSSLNDPIGIAVDAEGNIWVGDNGNNRVLQFGMNLSLNTAPANLAGTALGVSSIAWTWNASAGATGYRFYPSDGGPTSALDGTSFIRTGLSTNTAYGAQVSAVNASGEGTLSKFATRFTRAAAPSALVPSAVNITSLTFTWDANTNPPGTAYQVTYVRTIDAATKTTPAGTGTSLTLNGLLGGTTYSFTVSALNGDSIATVGASTRAVTAGTSFASAPVSSTATTTVVYTAPTGPIMVTVPPDAFNVPVTVTVKSPLDPLPPASAARFSLLGTDIAVEIVLDQPLQPAVPVPLSIGYTAAALAASGITDASTLVIARYDTTAGLWVPLVSSVDTANGTVSALTSHFSLFQIMQVKPAAAVSSVKVFPNPLRPSLGHTAMTFTQLPAGARLKIYTLAMELVAELSANASGMASWDGTNKSGARAASGVYFVFAESTGGGGSKTFKVAIER